MDGFSKTRQNIARISRITGFEDAPFGEAFPLQATLPDLKLGESECVIVSIRKTAADFVPEIGQHVDNSVLRSQRSLVRDDIVTPLFGSCTTFIAWYFPENLDGIRLLEIH